ncbi:sugar ABC transporter permease [Vallitalea pronyensis]|uniref:Sugar ABC transporter permease n=1 Tax=Vallitalea pronyensis TaxID=1348613 RepID=A0A8J8MMB6_9FIRM|nr:ABC transporter permease subunit [Vallitalea pronyensis]QUI24166.1 sugar ABC transporter permease [Vallitalea pronyensis]
MKPKKKSIWTNAWEHRALLIMVLPAMVIIILFNFVPMGGITLAFRNADHSHLPYGTEWVGLKNFSFLTDKYFLTTVKNTVVIAGLKILFGFPAPIILALLLNEVLHVRFKRIIQTVSYLPHFIAWVFIANLLDRLLNSDVGLFNEIIRAFGGETIHFMGEIKYFLPIVIISAIWKEIGFSSIIYLAAITQISPGLYDAAKVDGCGRLGRIWHVTLPGIMPIVSMMLILTIPKLLNADFDQLYLLGNPINQPVSEILDTYVLRTGLSYGNFSKAIAIGLCGSIVSMVLLVISNKISRRLGGSTLW